MSDYQYPDFDHDDPQLRRFFEPLAQLPAPAGSRRRNRAAVSAELNHLSETSGLAIGPSSSWWRRSVAIPLPLAAAAALLVVAMLAWQQAAYQRLAGQVEQLTTAGHTPAAASPGAAPPGSTSTDETHTVLAADDEAESRSAVEYAQSQVYLNGFGQLASQTYYYDGGYGR